MTTKEALKHFTQLEEKAEKLDTLAGEIIATLYLNRLRGTISTIDDKHFDQIIEDWKSRRASANNLVSCSNLADVEKVEVALLEGEVLSGDYSVRTVRYGDRQGNDGYHPPGHPEPSVIRINGFWKRCSLAEWRSSGERGYQIK